MDWKLYLFISSLKRLSMKCADRAFTLLLSILITFSTESLPSAISSCMVSGAFWWWKLWMPFLAHHRLCPLPCVGNLKGAIQAARRLVWCMGLIPWKALPTAWRGPGIKHGGEAHHGHLSAGYLSGRDPILRGVCEVSCWGWWGRASVQAEFLRRWCQVFWSHFKKLLNNLLEGRK